MPLFTSWYAIIIPIQIILHLLVAPYTKVEESFNIQAIHDLLRYGVPVANAAVKFRALFDHMTFSGSVPRTFVGAIVTAALSKPLVSLGGLDGLAAQTIARSVVGLLNAAALVFYIRSVRKAYGNSCAVWYTFLQASQFHVFFYASRTLPNMFAFCLSTFASAAFLPEPTATPADRVKRLRRGFFLLTFAAVIFRSELVLLIASYAGNEILKCRSLDSVYSLIRRVIAPAVTIAGVASAIISVSIDTYFWQSDRFLLPELSAFVFNIFPKDHQGASAWGTSPWHWYLTSTIPRLIPGPALLLIPYGLLLTTQQVPILDALIPSLAYTAVYSILAHKETRFLFPIIPSLTLATALPASYLSLRRDRGSKTITKLLVAATAATAIVSHVILLPLSALSYPGGHALQALHAYHHQHKLLSEQPDTNNNPQQYVHVHLTNLALQSGITLFLEQPLESPPSEKLFFSSSTTLLTGPRWIYDKTPTAPGLGDVTTTATVTSTNTTTTAAAAAGSASTAINDSAFWSQFDYLILEPHMTAHLVSDESSSPYVYERIISIPSLRRTRPRLLHPSSSHHHCRFLSSSSSTSHSNLEAEPEPVGTGGLHELLQLMYGSRIAWAYGLVHDVLREGCGIGIGRNKNKGLTRGWWVDWGVEEGLLVVARREKKIKNWG